MSLLCQSALWGLKLIIWQWLIYIHNRLTPWLFQLFCFLVFGTRWLDAALNVQFLVVPQYIVKKYCLINISLLIKFVVLIKITYSFASLLLMLQPARWLLLYCFLIRKGTLVLFEELWLIFDLFNILLITILILRKHDHILILQAFRGLHWWLSSTFIQLICFAKIEFFIIKVCSKQFSLI